MSEVIDLDQLSAAGQARGLIVRGAFHTCATDDVPLLSDGGRAATLVLFGSVGGSLWPHFSSAPEARLAVHPLDSWTRRVTAELAQELGATALFPFGGPPHLPFQRWAMRAEPVHVSPLGLLIHSDYGLWHAYRAALAFGARISLPAPSARPSPCLTCADRPCLTACPVAAFTCAGYDVRRCAAHVNGPEGDPCLERACLARRACPVGREHAYEPEQSRFHLGAFQRAYAVP